MRHVTLTSVPRLHHEHFLTSISCQVGVSQTMCFSVVKAKLKSKTHQIHENRPILSVALQYYITLEHVNV